MLLPKAIQVLSLFLWAQGKAPRGLRVLKTTLGEAPAHEVNAPCLKVIVQER